MMMNKYLPNFEYLDQNGSFRFANPKNIHELYFPLCNEAGLMSCVTPTLHGDIKTDQQHFILSPATVEDLHNTRSARNFWLYIHGEGPWSITGNSSKQLSVRFTEEDPYARIIEAGPLWHKLIYMDTSRMLRCETTNFVPSQNDRLEIMHIRIQNQGSRPLEFTPTSAIPLYGRSAENIRDHRHVTSLINRAEILPNGVLVQPEIIFNEKGHQYNTTFYYVVGCEGDAAAPVGIIPAVRDFIGEAGTFEWPETVVRNISPDNFTEHPIDGQEYVGALRFKDCYLAPGEKKEYILLIGIGNDKNVIHEMLDNYGSSEKAEKALNENNAYWSKQAEKISFQSGLHDFSLWMRWVSLQPIFRKIYGCSFLPYHDYGKGGRGWRDLWQDCLSLILQDPSTVKPLLINNFAGVRADGTNATIIGSKPGEFIADRNSIARVWMDHGTWPYLTTRLYIDQSGDFSLLMKEQTYFRDALILRAGSKDESWTPDQGVMLKCDNGSIYTGTLLEHLLVQHLTSFFNVGEHNIIRLEGADWNDTLDMARERGESVAFTALYASNLAGLADLIREAADHLKLERIEIFEELGQLVDTLKDKADYDSINYKQNVFKAYLRSVSGNLSGKQLSVGVEDLAADLREKARWIYHHLIENELVKTCSGDVYFNGYYNNDGQKVDGEFEDGVRMNLTAQVFTAMFGLASEEQVHQGYIACKKYLKDPNTGGYRLNTPLGPNKLNFGRGFAFAYGEKENGATFCHMAVMYMNALYSRHFVHEAYEVFKSLYDLSSGISTASIYPGIPEYFNAAGKGLYHYLTGSASWLLLTVLTQMYGVRGDYGDLVLEPKLTAEQFDARGKASVKTTFRGKKIQVRYNNPKKLDYGQYTIEKVELNGKILESITGSSSFRFSGQQIENAAAGLDFVITLSAL